MICFYEFFSQALKLTLSPYLLLIGIIILNSLKQFIKQNLI